MSHSGTPIEAALASRPAPTGGPASRMDPAPAADRATRTDRVPTTDRAAQAGSAPTTDPSTTTGIAQGAGSAARSEASGETDPALPGGRLPRHLGVIVDGNRRWARASGITTADGHSRGAEKIREMLEWCEELGIEHVTVWMLSTDNLSRTADELGALYGIIEDSVERIVDAGFAVQLAGCVDVLPAHTRDRLAVLLERARGERRVMVNLAIGYGGRREIVDGVRSLVRELAAQGLSGEEIAEQITVEQVGQKLYTAGQPDPDFVIRTSGEQRTSGFLLWQSVHTELWFTRTHWPAFEREEFLEALADYCRRERRFGC